MKTIIDLFLITFICVFVIDVSGIVDYVKEKIIKKKTNGVFKDTSFLQMKPFDCSLCMSWWTCIIYLICIHDFTLMNLAVVTLFAALTGNIKNAIYLIKDILTTINKIFYKIIDKL